MSSYFDTPYGALMLDEIENYKYLIKELTEFVAEGVNIGAAVHNRALAHWEIGQIDLALTDFNAAIAALPKSHMPAKHKGIMLHKLGKFSDALAALDLAVSIAPDEVTVRRTRGRIRADAGMLEEAIADFDYAVQLDPSFKFTIDERDRLKEEMKARS